MKISCEHFDPTIRQAVFLFHSHIKDFEFGLKILDHSYNHTSDTARQIAYKIKNDFSSKITVTSYKSFLPFSKAVAYAKDGKIFFNERHSGSIADRLETLAHEYMHILGYSHSGNRVTQYNLQTVPYKIGRIFKDYVLSLEK